MLESTIALLQTALVFLVGLTIRALIAVAIIAAIALPIAGVLMAWKGLQRLGERASGLRRVGHLRWRHGNYYAPGHLWVRPSGAASVRIGLDDVAQRVLPEIDDVTLPAEGTVVKKGDVLGLIRCFNGTVPLRAPLGGVIAAVNSAVRRTPSLLHQDPYRRAWLVDVRTDGSEHTSLPSGRRARAWLAREDERLTQFLEHQLGIAAADGGELMVPPHRLLSPEQWEAVMQGFLAEDGRTGEMPNEKCEM
jgi:glycine cleavage system H lipoate-binding protein